MMYIAFLYLAVDVSLIGFLSQTMFDSIFFFFVPLP